MAEKVKGLTDEAAERDLFEIQKYIDGLTQFIETCNTPMTISIQGSWGTGKTSIMQIINNTLAERTPQTTHNIWFNTWQFSQFNMDDDLTVSLLSCLLNELSESEEEKKNARAITQALRFAGRIGKELLLTAVDSKIGGKAADNADGLLSRLLSEQGDPATTVKNLKKQFSACVEETLKKTGKKRVVIFIDDLDRLTPRRAVELLEVLKLFLDCKNCVFVLAIDYAVVCRGVEAKYGDLSDDKAESAEKGRSFFDKIIQVPFKMPVAHYNIENYVKSCFREINIECPEAEIETYVDLIKSSIGVNPRSMKRLFNAYLLLTIVVSEEILSSDKNKQLLFGVLCLQHSYEKIYNFIVRKQEKLSYHLLETLSVAETQEGLEEKLNDKSLNIDDVLRVQNFLELMIRVIDVNGDHEVSEEEIKNLRNVLVVSTLTSPGEDIAPKRKARIADTVQELGLENALEIQLNALLSELKKFGEDVVISIRDNVYPHIMAKNYSKKTFVDIWWKNDVILPDCITEILKVKNQEAEEIIKKYEKGTPERFKDRLVTIPLTSEEARKDFLTLAKFCYENCK